MAVDALVTKLRSYPQKSPAEVDAWYLQNDIKPRMGRWGFEPRFQVCITEWCNEAQERVYNDVQGLLRRVGAIVAMVGERGTGKTTIAAQIAWRMAVERGLEERGDKTPAYFRSVSYSKATKVINRFKALYVDYGSTIDIEELNYRRELYCNNDLVIIDELHECEDMKLKNRILTDIIDTRYARKLDTILISNQTPAEFMGTNSDSVISRLGEHGRIIPCEWASWRTR